MSGPSSSQGGNSRTRKRAKKEARSADAPSAEARHQMIAEEAYFRAQSRGFEGGDPNADWLAAEREVLARLARG